MPARAPTATPSAALRLARLGEALRARRLQLGVGSVAAAEAAGLSRVTLHRIERGEPSVTMAAYLAAAESIGLGIGIERDVTAAAHEAPAARPAALDARLAPAPDAMAAPAPASRIRPADHPQLRQLAWQLAPGATLTRAEALSLYERNWRHVDPDAMDAAERALLQSLVLTEGGGRLLV